MNVFVIGIFLIISTTTLAATPAVLLTPLITKNQIQEARNLSKVDPSLFLNTTSHSGFLTVDQKYNSNLFFWYFPVADKPVNETPWILWLQGGPGASSIVGVFDEIGPFQYEKELKQREWTWAKSHSMLFIDNPVGAGFSFTENEKGYVHNMDECSSHLYIALRQFLTLFPELSKAPLYLAGESYAGRYVPAIAMKILQQDSRIGELSVNLQGLILGNPIISHVDIADYSSVFYNWGLIDSQGVLSVKKLQDEYLNALQEKDPVKSNNLRNKLLDALQDVSMQPQTYNMLKDEMGDDITRYADYIKKPEVYHALHAGDMNFQMSNERVYAALISDFLNDDTSQLETLLDHYRILIYCGQLDLTTSCVLSAEARRKRWHWSRRDQFIMAPRVPWWYNESVAGYVKNGGSFTEVLVRGAGHLAPIDKPAQMQQLVSYFIRGLDMPLPPNYQVQDKIPDYVESEKPRNVPSNTNTLVVASFVVNVVLILIILGGVLYFVYWKRRNEALFYNTMDDSSVDGILTMT